MVVVYPDHTHLLFSANAEKQKSKKRAPIPCYKKSNPANKMYLADFVFCDLIEVCKDQLLDNNTNLKIQRKQWNVLEMFVLE